MTRGSLFCGASLQRYTGCWPIIFEERHIKERELKEWKRKHEKIHLHTSEYRILIDAHKERERERYIYIYIYSTKTRASIHDIELHDQMIK